MLNELLVVERGATQAGIGMVFRHPDLKDSTKNKPTLHVCLDPHGHVAQVQAMPLSRLKEKPLWKLSEGQKNSFPFVQTKSIWDNVTVLSWKQSLSKKPTDWERREGLLRIASESTIRSDDLGEWTSEGIMKALRKRRRDLVALEQSAIAALPVAIDRFLLAIDKSVGGDPTRLCHEIADKLIQELKVSADSDLLATSVALLTESDSKGGAFYFDAEGNFPFQLIDTGVEGLLSKHLRQIDIERAKRTGTCSITGEEGVLVVDNFSQPNLPTIQQSFLFARNSLIPSASRYGRTAADSMLVGYMTDIRLRAAIELLCTQDRRGKTWRAIPSEVSKQSDLLLAFVHKVMDAPAVALLTEKGEDLSEEEADTSVNQAGSVAAFEERTKRLIQAVQARVGVDWHTTPVSLAILRKVDPANRKVIYTNSPTISDLYRAATNWVAGERNVPYWLKLPVLLKDESLPIVLAPPHVAPLGMIGFLKKTFFRGGTESQEIAGLPASETLKIFLDPSRDDYGAGKGRIKRMLRLTLGRRVQLMVGVGHIVHTPESWLRRKDSMRKFNIHEGLRTITLLGILLYKLDRRKEVYMKQTAFKLGQLLAAADIVHAGYCADVRGGDVPPALLGNQVFTMAQSAPSKALAMLCRRWKTYDGWAKKASRDPDRVAMLVASNLKDEQRRGWEIRTALRYAREIGPLAGEIAPALEAYRVNDVFLAELLLGYMAGLPKTQKEGRDAQDTDHNDTNDTQEE